MDLKALIAKMDQIESKKILTEGEDRPDAKKTDTTWTDKSGKKHPATRVQGSKSVAADKDADKERKKNDKSLDEMTLQSAIAQELLKEFNIAIEEEEIEEAAPIANPYTGADAAKFAAMSPQDQEWLTRDGGKPDISGQGLTNGPDFNAILARAPNKGRAVAAAPGGAVGAGTKPAEPAAPTDAEIAANNAALGNWTDQPDTGGAATKPAATDPAVTATREKLKALLDKLEKTGGVSGAATAAPAARAAGPATPAAKPATGAGTKPANSLPGKAVPGGGNIADTPAAESVAKLADDQILAIIRNI